MGKFLNIHQKLDYIHFGNLLDYKYHQYMINNFLDKVSKQFLEFKDLGWEKLVKQSQIQARIAINTCLLNWRSFKHMRYI